MKRTLLMAVIASALVLTACNDVNDTKADKTTSDISETAMTETAMAETTLMTEYQAQTEVPFIADEEQTEFTTSISDGDELYTVYWEENGEEKSEQRIGQKMPHVIINAVIEKYYGEDTGMFFEASDWVIYDYPEENEDEEGGVVMHHMGELDISEGYSASIGGEDIQKVTESIAKSFIASYELDSVSISELQRNILYITK